MVIGVGFAPIELRLILMHRLREWEFAYYDPDTGTNRSRAPAAQIGRLCTHFKRPLYAPDAVHIGGSFAARLPAVY
jgi:hypothetical protein